MAIEITRKYPGREGKEQILEWYLNYNFYGNAAYGIEAAAQVYYDKTVADLTARRGRRARRDSAVPRPEPVPGARRTRTAGSARCSTSMLEAGYLTPEAGRRGDALLQHAAAQRPGREGSAQPERPAADRQGRPAGHGPRPQRAGQGRRASRRRRPTRPRSCPARCGSTRASPRRSASRCRRTRRILRCTCWSSFRRSTTRLRTPTTSGRTGCRVYTTLDWDLQTYAECVARSHIASLQLKTAPSPARNDLATLPPVPEALKQNFDHEVGNAAVVAIRPPTGEVLAMVGSLDYFDDDIDGQVNVARRAAAARLLVQAVHLSDRVRVRRVLAVVDGDGCPDGVPRPGQPALRAGELRPQVSRPADAAPGATALIQHPGRLADGPGGHRERHQDRRAGWA